MLYRTIIALTILSILLAGCSSGGPTNAEAEQVIYGVYFRKAAVIEKQKCDTIPSWLEEEGFQNIWLVRYRFEESGNPGSMLIAESDSGEYPWVPAGPMMESCP